MLTNDLKKSARIRLSNGWLATLVDNKKGNTRLADVEGHYREIGSVYAHDIAEVQIDGTWREIDYTPAQIKLHQTVGAFHG